MKKISFSIVLLVLCIFISAQVPESFNYQVAVRDGVSNDPLTNQDVSFRMSILKGSTSGDAVYTEYHSANTGELGIVNLVIGNGTGKVGAISPIDWGADTYFLKVEIDKTGGSSYVEMGTTQLLSVPYAMYSHTASIVKIRSSMFGDTLFLGTQQYVIIPGISLANPYYRSNEPITDIDGNIYKTVTIGNQVWMAENLKTTKYNDGVVIPLVTDNTEWKGLYTPGYCLYNNDADTYKDTYGALYNGYAISSTNNGNKNICPTGWHVPTDGEWTTLMTYLGGVSVAGGKLKEIGTTHWNSPNFGATNETGFTALPGGYRYLDGTFNFIWTDGFWWSATETGALAIYVYNIDCDISGVGRDSILKKHGTSVRCIKD